MSRPNLLCYARLSLWKVRTLQITQDLAWMGSCLHSRSCGAAPIDAAFTPQRDSLPSA